MIHCTYGATDQVIGATAFGKRVHVSKTAVIKIHAEAGRNAVSITLTPDKTREFIEELIQALWAAEQG